MIGIKIWLANNIKYQQPITPMTMPSWNLSQVKNLNSVQNVNFGWKKIKDVIIWLVNANFNSVINVAVFIWNVNAWLKHKSRWEEEDRCKFKDKEKKHKRHKKEKLKLLKQYQKEAEGKKDDTIFLLYEKF